MGQGIYKNEKQSLKSFWYNGTETIKKGYAMCLDRDNTTGLDGSGVAEPATDYGWARHGWVEKPASGNLHNFAGIVDDARDRTGPCIVSIVEPEAIARSVNVFTSADCTADSTFLTVVAGSFELGTVGQGLLVAKALQTINRSSASGLAQAMVRAVDPFNMPFDQDVPSSANNVFAPAIWETCPWAEIQSGMIAGYTFFDDFMQIPILLDAPAAGSGGYITDQDTGVTILGNEEGDEVGGILEIANNDTDNDFGHIYLSSAVADSSRMIIAATEHKPFWFEARLKRETVGNNGIAHFIGLGETGLITLDGGALVDDTGEVKDENFIGFQTLAADGDALLPCFKADGQTKQTGTSTVAVADTYQNVGISGDGTIITMYIDGVSKKDVTAANIAAATFPSATHMTLMLLTKNTSNAAELYTRMDWWRFAQLR